MVSAAVAPDEAQAVNHKFQDWPRWLESGDRFWYAFETAQGRRFMLVDPVKRTKAPLWPAASPTFVPMLKPSGWNSRAVTASRMPSVHGPERPVSFPAPMMVLFSG